MGQSAEFDACPRRQASLFRDLEGGGIPLRSPQSLVCSWSRFSEDRDHVPHVAWGEVGIPHGHHDRAVPHEGLSHQSPSAPFRTLLCDDAILRFP